LDIIGRLFVNRHDEIVIPEFGYIQFPIVANRVGATLKSVAERDFTTDVDGLLAAISAKTKLVFLANPNNPTGTMVSADDVKRLALSLPSDVVLVIDLAYGEFVGEAYCAEIHKLVLMCENVIVTRTFSKAFGIAGLRVGWCHAPEWMIPGLYAARGMGPANAAAQAAAVAALGELHTVRSRVEQIVEARNRIANELEMLGMVVVPSSTNFLMAGLSSGNANRDSELADALAIHLFDDAGIVVNQTREAGLERFIRFSISLPEHNTLLIESVRRFLHLHNNG